MNRRKLLKGILGLGAASFAGRAIAEPVDDDNYWEAQRLIDEMHDVEPFVGHFSGPIFGSTIEPIEIRRWVDGVAVSEF